MKPLERGRRTLIWMGIQFADDEPIKGRYKLAQIVTSTIYAIVFIAFSSLHLIAFLQLDPINPEEFFFVLLQLVLSVHGFSAFITVYSYGSYITAVFQCLTEIYEKCKQIEHFSTKNQKLNQIICRSPRLFGYDQCAIRTSLWLFVQSNAKVDLLICNGAVGDHSYVVLLPPWRI